MQLQDWKDFRIRKRFSERSSRKNWVNLVSLTSLSCFRVSFTKRECMKLQTFSTYCGLKNWTITKSTICGSTCSTPKTEYVSGTGLCLPTDISGNWQILSTLKEEISRRFIKRMSSKMCRKTNNSYFSKRKQTWKLLSKLRWMRPLLTSRDRTSN